MSGQSIDAVSLVHPVEDRFEPGHRALAFPPGAETTSLTKASVIRGSSPSVWPLSSRTTSAITCPPLAFGYT